MVLSKMGFCDFDKVMDCWKKQNIKNWTSFERHELLHLIMDSFEDNFNSLREEINSLKRVIELRDEFIENLENK